MTTGEQKARVTYLPLGLYGAWVWPLIFLLAFMASISVGILELIDPHQRLWGVAHIPLSFVWLLIGWGIAGFGRVEIDWRAGTISLIVVRWFITSKKRTFPLASIQDVIVSASRGRRLPDYWVDFIVDDDVVVSLLPSGSRHRERAERAVAEIRGLLKR